MGITAQRCEVCALWAPTNTEVKSFFGGYAHGERLDSNEWAAILEFGGLLGTEDDARQMQHRHVVVEEVVLEISSAFGVGEEFRL